MTTFGIAMVKDECDVIEGTIRHLADEGMAGIVIADNGSTDGTREILDELAHDESLPCPLHVFDDPEIGYYQSRKVSALAEVAGGFGADWIVPFDADELWIAPDRVAVTLERLPPFVRVVEASITHHFRTRFDVDDPDPFVSMEWHDPHVAHLVKVAFRHQPGVTVQQGNHGVVFADGPTQSVPGLALRHFPVRSEDQFVKKSKNGSQAYAATDLPESAGLHWREYGRHLAVGGEDALRQIYREHWFYRDRKSVV